MRADLAIMWLTTKLELHTLSDQRSQVQTEYSLAKTNVHKSQLSHASILSKPDSASSTKSKNLLASIRSIPQILKDERLPDEGKRAEMKYREGIMGRRKQKFQKAVEHQARSDISEFDALSSTPGASERLMHSQSNAHKTRMRYEPKPGSIDDSSNVRRGRQEWQARYMVDLGGKVQKSITGAEPKDIPEKVDAVNNINGKVGFDHVRPWNVMQMELERERLEGVAGGRMTQMTEGSRH